MAANEPEETVPPGGFKPMESSIAVERSFRIDGKRVTVKAIFPATLGKQIGLENVYEAARRILIEVEGRQSKIVPLKLGEN